MLIVIKEENRFMPTTTIIIKDTVITVEENHVNRELKYDKNQIKLISDALLKIFKDWNYKYIDKKIIDDDTFTILVVDNERKEYYIKNKYPSNWSKFILFRNKLLREEL